MQASVHATPVAKPADIRQTTCTFVPAPRVHRRASTSSPTRVAACSAIVSVPLSAAAASIASNVPAYAPSILGGLSIGMFFTHTALA